MLYQFLILFGVSFLGKVIEYLLPFKFSATIISSVILFLLFEFKIIKVSSMKEIIEFCEKNMAIVFIPVGVNIMNYFYEFSPITWVKIVFICIVSTFLTIGFTGKISDILIKLRTKI